MNDETTRLALRTLWRLARLQGDTNDRAAALHLAADLGYTTAELEDDWKPTPVTTAYGVADAR